MELNEFKNLVSTIAEHDQRYHGDDNPIITDEAYNELVKQRNEAIRINPEWESYVMPLAAANASLKGDLAKVKHLNPMLSLENVHSYEQLKNSLFRVCGEDEDYVYEDKLDGLALSLVYRNGALVSLATRGTGTEGEQIVHQAKVFGNIPLLLKEPIDCEIRGEGFLTTTQFELLNKLSSRVYKTSRNAIAGISRKKEFDPTMEGLATFIPYDLLDLPELPTVYSDMNYRDRINTVVSYGFTRPNGSSLDSLINNVRSTVYPTDGIVIKVNSASKRNDLGETSGAPRWAVAYKFPPEVKNSTLNAVVWETGRLGSITPVAVYNPINLGGTTNDRSTLHNYGQFRKLKLRKGAEVIISRAADVIPYFVGVSKPGVGAIMQPPRVCPSCGEPVVYDGGDEEQIFLTCLNTLGCPAQRVGRYLGFVDRQGLNIIGLGDVAVNWLVTNQIITEYKDFFNLVNRRDEVPLGVIGVANWNKLMPRIERARHVEASRFIKGIGLPAVGIGTAKRIAEEARSHEDLLSLLQDVDRLTTIDDIGWATALTIAGAFSEHDGLLLKEVTAVLSEMTLEFVSTEHLKGALCFTGRFQMPRREMQQLFLRHGFELVSGVSKNTVGLIHGREYAEHKVEKAKKLNQPVYDISDLLPNEFESFIESL